MPVSRTTIACAVTIGTILAAPAILHGQQALVIDHESTDIEQIPDQWLDQARLLAFQQALRQIMGQGGFSDSRFAPQQHPPAGMDYVQLVGTRH